MNVGPPSLPSAMVHESPTSGSHSLDFGKHAMAIFEVPSRVGTISQQPILLLPLLLRPGAKARVISQLVQDFPHLLLIHILGD